MKKFYFFITAVLAMLCTVSVHAQKYSLLEEATVPEAGVTYVIMNAETNQFISCKYGPNGGLLEVMDDADVLWKLEATGEKTDANYDLWYLYSVGQQKYVQDVELEVGVNELVLECTAEDDSITKYNREVRSFPASVIAGILGFPVRDYLADAPEKADIPDDVFKR